MIGWSSATRPSTAVGSGTLWVLAEIEWSVLSSQCLDRRIPDKDTLRAEIAAWEQERNEPAATVNWRFTSPDARTKLRRVYPATS